MKEYKRTNTLCKVCNHKVYDMEKHIRTEEHRRNLRQAGLLEGGYHKQEVLQESGIDYNNQL